MSKSKFIRGLLVTSAVAMLAACSSDGNSSLGSGSGGGGGAGPLSALTSQELGVTGDGGATEALGVASLTDPILGTDGLLGGGSNGEIGGQIPADQLTPLSSQLAPVSDQIASALPLDMVTSQIPGLGVDGSGGLVQDLTGQDALTGVVGTTGVVGALLGGGNDGQLGNIVPEGTIPSLPGGSDPTAALTGLISGTPLAALTGGGSSSDLTGQLGNVPALAQTVVSGVQSNPQGVIESVTGALNPDTVTGLVSQLGSVASK